MSLIFHSVPFPITKIVELFVALLENFKISSESKTPVIFILTATYTTRPTFIDILLIMDTLLGTVTPKRELLFYKVIMLARSQLLEELIFKLFPSKETITSLSIGKNSVYLPE